VTVFFTQVGNVAPTGFEDPQPEQAQEGGQGKSLFGVTESLVKDFERAVEGSGSMVRFDIVLAPD
jgi:hypothetical protein